MITPSTAELFFAFLTLVVNVAVVAGAVLWVASRWSKGATRLLEEVRVELARFGVPLAFAVAGTAMAGSLYFSEVANYVPCTLCWYQRIGMYSLAIILLVAVIRSDRGIRPYGITLALVALPISIYHYLVEWFPSIETDVCSVGLSCSIVWFRSMGFVTLAYMAGSGFAFIALVLALTPRRSPYECADPRAKRNRSAATVRKAHEPSSRKWLVPAIIGGIVLLAAIIAIALSGGGDSNNADTEGLEQIRPVEVSGTALPDVPRQRGRLLRSGTRPAHPRGDAGSRSTAPR